MSGTIPTRQDVLDLESGKVKGEDKRIAKRFEKRYRTEISACIASITSTAITYPLDSVKTRMQIYTYMGFIDCARQTYLTEHIRGFFRGVTAPLASQTLVRTLSMSIYQKSKYKYSDWINKNFGIDPLVHANTPGAYPNIATVACFGAAGATAGTVISLLACPFEFTKLSAQVAELMAKNSVPLADASNPVKNVEQILKKVQPKRMPDGNQSANKSGSGTASEVSRSYQHKGTWKTAMNIVKNRGITGLYSGIGLHMMRDSLGTGIYFATYETGKQTLAAYRGDLTATSPLAVAGAGALCGITSWILIFPIDTAKAVYQQNCLMRGKGEKVEYPKIQFFRRRMYNGLGVSMGKSTIGAIVFFSVFEAVKKHINALSDIA